MEVTTESLPRNACQEEQRKPYTQDTKPNESCWLGVVVGIILISIILGIVSIVSLPPASPNQATLHRLCDAGRRGSETKRTFRCSPLGGKSQLELRLSHLLDPFVGYRLTSSRSCS